MAGQAERRERATCSCDHRASPPLSCPEAHPHPEEQVSVWELGPIPEVAHLVSAPGNQTLGAIAIRGPPRSGASLCRPKGSFTETAAPQPTQWVKGFGIFTLKHQCTAPNALPDRLSAALGLANWPLALGAGEMPPLGPARVPSPPTDAHCAPSWRVHVYLSACPAPSP
uniref:Uncharacterized protein n=1 Tax=Myotis myotis TaxID=51298 RepID=A0A7J7SRG2_MYOMY|nr:hypothetical protein mMyoMyo1_009409 [Myotis myotis]